MTCKKNKESFLALSSFLIIGLFSFSIGCSKDDSTPFFAQNPHLSFGIEPLNNSGADHQVQKIKKSKKSPTPPSSVGKLSLLSQLNPFLSGNSNLVTLQQPSPEEDPESSNFCNIDGFNLASDIIQLDELWIIEEGEEKASERTVTGLDYVAHGYIGAEFQDCVSLEFIEALYDSDTHRKPKREDSEGREVNEIAIESGQKKTAMWIRDEDTQEIQVRVYTEDESKNENLEPRHRWMETKTGVDIINDRGDGSFKKWIHLVSTTKHKANSTDSYSSPSVVQRMFFLHREPEDEEPSHIVGSIRFRDDDEPEDSSAQNKFTLGLSKLVKEFGAVVYFVKEKTDQATTFNARCTLTLETNYYGPTGEELSAGDELTQLKEKLGHHQIVALASKLPEEGLKDIIRTLGNGDALEECGFKDINSLLKVKDADDFEFAEPPEEDGDDAGDGANQQN